MTCIYNNTLTFFYSPIYFFPGKQIHFRTLIYLQEKCTTQIISFLLFVVEAPGRKCASSKAGGSWLAFAVLLLRLDFRCNINFRILLNKCYVMLQPRDESVL
ncbi:hypothetical protein ACJX0J_005965, partial [Zea mays]